MNIWGKKSHDIPPRKITDKVFAEAGTIGGRARSRHWRYALLLAVFWTTIVFVLLSWNLLRVYKNTRDIAYSESRAYFNKDQAFRFWGASHGGVYVPVDERTPPNPYLANIAERDIQTPSGKNLTLMNPAYMVRQMSEDFAGLYGVVGQLTSLKLLRPENAPDDWAREALEAFGQHIMEVVG